MPARYDHSVSDKKKKQLPAKAKDPADGEILDTFLEMKAIPFFVEPPKPKKARDTEPSVPKAVDDDVASFDEGDDDTVSTEVSDEVDFTAGTDTLCDDDLDD